jgi:hypothetical protein
VAQEFCLLVQSILAEPLILNCCGCHSVLISQSHVVYAAMGSSLTVPTTALSMAHAFSLHLQLTLQIDCSLKEKKSGACPATTEYRSPNSRVRWKLGFQSVIMTLQTYLEGSAVQRWLSQPNFFVSDIFEPNSLSAV